MFLAEVAYVCPAWQEWREGHAMGARYVRQAGMDTSDANAPSQRVHPLYAKHLYPYASQNQPMLTGRCCCSPANMMAAVQQRPTAATLWALKDCLVGA